MCFKKPDAMGLCSLEHELGGGGNEVTAGSHYVGKKGEKTDLAGNLLWSGMENEINFTCIVLALLQLLD